MKKYSIKKLVDYINYNNPRWLLLNCCELHYNKRTLQFRIETKDQNIRIGNAIDKDHAINWLLGFITFTNWSFTLEKIYNNLSFNE